MNKYVPFLEALPSLFKIQHVLELGSNLDTIKTILKFKDLFTYTSIPESKTIPEEMLKLATKNPRLNLTTNAPVSLFNYDLILVNDFKNTSKKIKVLNYIMYNLLPATIVVTQLENKDFYPSITKKYEEYVLKYAAPSEIGVYRRDSLPKNTLKKINSMIRRTNEVDFGVLDGYM